jgi:hypothetical protein
VKKILLITVIGLLLLSGMDVVALNNDITPSNTMKTGNRDFTHTVFAEDGTATWCGFCHYAREALQSIYDSGDYPFYYVCMVDDMNSHAEARNVEYNLQAFPVVFFDGGANVQLGGDTDNEANYRQAIVQTGVQPVADIDVSLNVDWLGDAAMDISVTVQNNQAQPYDGHIHVYVTEVSSSMGWSDTTGHPYTFPFLDYAINQPISIAEQDTWTDSVTWDGHDYNDGHGHNFGSIQYGNIMVIAAVFNNTIHQAYSYPPNEGPFNAHYVDDAAGFFVGSTGPNPPTNPHPTNGATNVTITQDVTWTGGPSGVTYDVYFGTMNPPQKVIGNQSASTYDPGTLGYQTSYYWRIVSWNSEGNSTQGPLWHFTTLINPNNAPSLPEITGPAQGKPGLTYKYTITAIDPEQDMLYCFVEWGDNTTTNLAGPFNSGNPFSVTHSWVVKGTYTVRVKVKDEHGAESPWATLDVKMPASYVFGQPFIQWLFERFPLLQHLFEM